MAELRTPAETTATSCCAPEAQVTCCEPSAKAECCDPSHRDGCGCSAQGHRKWQRPVTFVSRCASATPPPRSRSRPLTLAPVAAHRATPLTAAARYSARRCTRSATTNSYPTSPSWLPSAVTTPPPSPNCTRARRSSTSAPVAVSTCCSPPQARRPDRPRRTRALQARPRRSHRGPRGLRRPRPTRHSLTAIHMEAPLWRGSDASAFPRKRALADARLVRSEIVRCTSVQSGRLTRSLLR
jgi:hypothetical protein